MLSQRASGTECDRHREAVMPEAARKSNNRLRRSCCGVDRMFSLSGRRRPAGMLLVVMIWLAGVLARTNEAQAAELVQSPSILSVQYAMTVPAMTPRPIINIAPHTHQIRKVHLAPEPYSYLLATVGVLGILTMGTFFRRRKPPLNRANSSRGPRAPRMAPYFNPVTGTHKTIPGASKQ